MAFSLFSKQVAKARPVPPGGGMAERSQPALRPAPPPAEAPRPPSAKPAPFASTTHFAEATNWHPRHARIEVSDSAPGLTPVLENAALLFANGQAALARAALEAGLREDRDTQRAVLAWLALFDLLQREGDRASFEQLALQYVVVFERSAPTWEESRRTVPASRQPSRITQPRVVVLAGELGPGCAQQVEALARGADMQGSIRLDVSEVETVAESGARPLVETLRDLRRRKVVLQWKGLEHLRRLLEEVAQGADPEREGCWLLLLELLQWQGDSAAFEERAIEYAITFELSPPSWEPLAALRQELAAEPEPAAGGDEASDVLSITGTLAGSVDGQIARLHDFAGGQEQVFVDLSGVERIDFVCAGALYNAIQQLARRDTVVLLAGASAIIRSLLLLIGIPPQYFAKRRQ